MTGLILAGYGICIANIIFTAKSKCKDSVLGKLTLANSGIFLAVASVMIVFVHIVIWVPICCSNRTNTEKVTPNDESSIGLKTNAVT
jgi:hypothetical protein